MIAIHGAVANAATWIPLQQSLGAAADVIAADLPGHGTRRDRAFVLDDAIGELTAQVAAESARRPVVLAGDSLGGYLALAVAARIGGALRGVVAGSCTYPMRGPWARAARASLLADPLVPAGAAALLMQRVCRADVASAIIARGLAPAMRGHTLRALLGHDVRADIAAIAAPVVFIDGALDLPIAWFARTFARTARNGRAVIVPWATHGVGLTHAGVFAREIVALLHEGGVNSVDGSRRAR